MATPPNGSLILLKLQLSPCTSQPGSISGIDSTWGPSPVTEYEAVKNDGARELSRLQEMPLHHLPHCCTLFVI